MKEYVIVGNAILRVDAESESEALCLAEESIDGEWEINDMCVADVVDLASSGKGGEQG